LTSDEKQQRPELTLVPDPLLPKAG
jgi:hypothetical protein